ncbi:hypothetical protein GCM10027090_40230 [Sinomonas soli]
MQGCGGTHLVKILHGTDAAVRAIDPVVVADPFERLRQERNGVALEIEDAGVPASPSRLRRSAVDELGLMGVHTENALKTS